MSEIYRALYETTRPLAVIASETGISQETLLSLLDTKVNIIQAIGYQRANLLRERALWPAQKSPCDRGLNQVARWEACEYMKLREVTRKELVENCPSIRKAYIPMNFCANLTRALMAYGCIKKTGTTYIKGGNNRKGGQQATFKLCRGWEKKLIKSCGEKKREY